MSGISQSASGSNDLFLERAEPLLEQRSPGRDLAQPKEGQNVPEITRMICS